MIDFAPTVADWISELAALGGPNTLLWAAGADEGALDLTQAHPAGLTKLLSGNDTRIRELIREPSAQAAALTRAAAIVAKDRELRTERGLAGAHLGIGAASWTEPSSRLPNAPVFLRAAALRPTDATLSDFTIEPRGDLTFNGALADYLAAVRGVRVPQSELVRLCLSGEAFDPSPAYAALARLAEGVAGWRVRNTLALGTYPFAKAAAVADLRRIAERVGSHPVLRSLAAPPPSAVPPAGDVVDPDEVFLLDADAEQVALLEAVRRGETVVVDAGPGTGKSQTVANVGADAIDRGERVLVVAETGGARREVIRHLDEHGLAHLVEEPGMTGRPVVAAFDDAEEDDDIDWAAGRAAAGRELDAHVACLYDSRAPWAVSLAEVQNRLVELTAGPKTPRTKVRFESATWATLDRAAMSEWGSRLAAVADAGAWQDTGSVGDPWFGARVSSTDDVKEVEDALGAVSAEGIGQLQATFGAALRGVALPELPTLGHYRDFIAEFAEIKAVLEVFRVGIFDSEPPSNSPDGAVARVQRALRVRGHVRPGAPTTNLAALAERAHRVRPLWGVVRQSELLPTEVEGLEEARAAYARVDGGLMVLTDRLNRPADAPRLEDLPLAELGNLVDMLNGARSRLAVLPMVNAELDEARAAGLGGLVTDLATRGVPASQVHREVEFAWWASVLVAVTRKDHGYAAFDGTALRAAGVAYGEADRALQRRASHDLATRRVRRGEPPVTVLSPLAVANTPSAQRIFDLVVVDDAQTLTVASTASALARAGRAVIVGDSRGLGPVPMSFQPGSAGHDSPLVPSLLELASQRWPVHTYTTHYRCLDPRLITPVNTTVYAGQLRTFPAPELASALTWQRVESEQLAVAVATAVVAQVRANPAQSVGVVTLGPGLAEAVEHALRTLADSAADLGPLLDEGGPEPFFVRDGSRVVGQVRDRMVVAISGVPAEGGESAALRTLPRLTTALTRARAAMTVLTDFDVDTGESTDEVSRLLNAVAASAKSPPNVVGAEPNSALLGELARRLRERGLTVTAGWGDVVDLAVSDPIEKRAATLAVEIDGPSWAATVGTRSRERLRGDELRRRGWEHLRVSSVELFRDPAREVARVVATVERLERQPAVPAVPASPLPATSDPAPDEVRPPGTESGAGVRVPSPVSRPEQSRDDTDEGWGERTEESAHDRWLEENRPPHWE